MPFEAPRTTTRQEIADAVARLLGTEVRRFDFINGGRNNRVGRVSSDGGEFAVKAYFRDPRDRRTRLRAEYSMLEFLWRCGVRCIPEPLAVDRDLDIAVYRFVEGERPVAEALDAADTGALAALLGTMWALRGEAGAGALDTASEACFSVADYVDVVTRRRQRVVSHLGEELDDTRARAFLDGPFFRVFAEARTNAEAAADHAAALPPDAWTLSPSDHGFHNALRTPDGEWVFLDFEYAGWDDPAKMIADACLQPEIPIPDHCRPSFFDDVLGRIGDTGPVRRRLALVYPLLGLKWCMIMLNEFVPESARRRRFSRTVDADAKRRQLTKAEAFLARVERDMDRADFFGL